MEYTELASVVEKKISGDWGSEPKNDCNDVKVIRTADFKNDGTINYDNAVIRNVEHKKIIEKKLLPGDIIVEKSGGTNNNPVGRVVYFTKEDNNYLSNNFTETIRCNNTFNSKYIYYCLKYKYSIGCTLNMFNKTTGIQNLKMSQYLKQTIRIFPRVEQDKIVKVLDKIELMINGKKKQIDYLNQIIKSQFIEMFENRSFDKIAIGKCAKFQGGYAFKSKDFVENGIKLVQISNVNKDTLDWIEVNRVPENFEEKYKEYSLRENDVLMAMTRPIIKSLNEVKIAIVTGKDLPCLLNQRVGRFIINEKLNKEYLIYCCKSDKFKNYVEKMSGNSLQPNISSKQVENYEINLPPIELQNKFAEFVKQIDKQKFEFEKSLKKLEELQASLMQEYFG